MEANRCLMCYDAPCTRACPTHIDIPRYVRLLKAGKMTLDGLVTHEFPLAEVNEAIATVRRGEAGRVLLRMD